MATTHPTDTDWSDKARAMVQVIRDDIASDVRRIDGAPFDGATVATAIGNLAAQVDALARIVGDLIWLADERWDVTERTGSLG